MADLLAKSLGAVIAVSTIVTFIQAPVVLVFFAIIFGIVYFINPKL